MIPFLYELSWYMIAGLSRYVSLKQNQSWETRTQVKVNGPVHARSKHARYMHNDAQV